MRAYRPDDRDAVRKLCCDTGFLGQPIDPVFEDRELFADFLTAYYTDAEPESAFVLEENGEVTGYLLGCRHPDRRKRFLRSQFLRLGLRTVGRYPFYKAPTRRYLHWMIWNARREVPPAPEGVPHFHINLLPEAKSIPMTRELMNRFMRYLSKHGETQVYGQMVTFAERRTTRLFERYGFRVLNRSEVTKFRRYHSEPVYLCTVLKDLTEDDQMGGRK